MIKILHCGDTSSLATSSQNCQGKLERTRCTILKDDTVYLYALQIRELEKGVCLPNQIACFLPCSSSHSYTICSSIIVPVASLVLLLSIFLILNFFHIIFLYIISSEFSKQNFPCFTYFLPEFLTFFRSSVLPLFSRIFATPPNLTLSVKLAIFFLTPPLSEY